MASVAEVIRIPFSVSQPPVSHVQRSRQNMRIVYRTNIFLNLSFGLLSRSSTFKYVFTRPTASPLPWLLIESNVSPDCVSVKHKLRCKTETQVMQQTLLPHKNVNRTCAYLQLSLLHSSCLTWFYPSRIPDSEQESFFLSASPSYLMPMLCLHLKHSSSPPPSEVVSQCISAKSFRSEAKAQSFMLEVT